MEEIEYLGLSEEDSKRLNDIRRRIEAGEEVQVEGMKVPQRKFKTPEELRVGGNNFYGHFTTNDNEFCIRRASFFKKFRETYPEFERDLTERCIRIKDPKQLPWEDLLKAYNLMAEFVECHYGDPMKGEELICYDDITVLLR